MKLSYEMKSFIDGYLHEASQNSQTLCVHWDHGAKMSITTIKSITNQVITEVPLSHSHIYLNLNIKHRNFNLIFSNENIRGIRQRVTSSTFRSTVIPDARISMVALLLRRQLIPERR